MIAKQGYTTAEAMVNEILTNIGITGKIEEDILKRWASRAAESVIGTEQLIYSLAIIDVKGNVGALPKHLHSIYAAAVISDFSQVWNRESLVGYTKEVYGTNCDVEVNLICPTCNSDQCTCGSKTLDLQVDDLYLMSRPYLWAMTQDRYIGYSATTTDGFPTSSRPKLDWMVPRKSDNIFWNSEYYLGKCARLGEVSQYTYDIEPPNFITNLEEGQVLISYLRKPIDDEGYYLIPKYSKVLDAVTMQMTERIMWREYMKAGNQTDRLRWIDAKKQADMMMNEARAELEMPSPEKWTAILQKHWLQDRGRFHYGKP